nr:porin [Limnohabitans curvus]
MAATSAFAQNVVSLYGTLDMGVGNISYKLNDIVQTTRSGAQSSANDTSRWGMTGTEDLGGGMAAEFKIEQGIGTNPRSGIAKDLTLTNGTSNGNAYTLDNTVLGDRELWAAVKSGAARVQVGYGVTGMRNLAVQTDAAQSNQFGNQIAHDVGAYRRAGVRVDYNLAGGWLVSGGVSGNRSNQGTVATGSGATAPALGGELRNGKGWTLGAQYTQGPINAGYFHDEVTSQSPAVLAANYAQSPAPYLTIAAAAANTTKKTDLLAASYDMGVAKLYGQYYSQKAVQNDDATDTGAGAGKIQGTSFGVRVPVGKATFFAQSLNMKDKQYVAAATGEDRKYTGSSFGVRYDVSKRTYAYVNTGSLKKDASAGSNSAGTSLANNNGTKYQQTALGIVHSF